MATNPIPVEIAKWTPTTYGVWSLVIVQCFFVIGLVIRKGPDWLARWIDYRKQEGDTERENRAAKAAEDAAAETRRAAEKIAIAERMDQLEDRVTRMGQAVSFLMNAAITATNALPPDHPAVKQSRDLIALAASSIGTEDPFGKSLATLATFRGVGE